MTTPTGTVISQDSLSDEEVVARVRAGETSMFEIVMRRYNQLLYRVARAILRNDGEAEDVMQDAYVRGIGSELNGKIEAALADRQTGTWPETLVLYRMRPEFSMRAAGCCGRIRYSRLKEAAGGGGMDIESVIGL